MNKIESILSPEQARNIALDEAGVKGADFSEETLESENGGELYRLEYSTDYMEYCCYIDARKGTVIGFDYQPSVA